MVYLGLVKKILNCSFLNYVFRERATVFTQFSSDPTISVFPEFCFKGVGSRTKLNPPSGIKYQWAEKGSYR